ELGIPGQLAHLEDTIFESLPDELAQAWPERFMGAIGVGADLEEVWPRFAVWLMVDERWGVFGATDDEEVRAICRRVADGYTRTGDGDPPSDEEAATLAKDAWSAWEARATVATADQWAARAARATWDGRPEPPQPRGLRGTSGINTSRRPPASSSSCSKRPTDTCALLRRSAERTRLRRAWLRCQPPPQRLAYEQPIRNIGHGHGRDHSTDDPSRLRSRLPHLSSFLERCAPVYSAPSANRPTDARDRSTRRQRVHARPHVRPVCLAIGPGAPTLVSSTASRRTTRSQPGESRGCIAQEDPHRPACSQRWRCFWPSAGAPWRPATI